MARPGVATAYKQLRFQQVQQAKSTQPARLTLAGPGTNKFSPGGQTFQPFGPIPGGGGSNPFAPTGGGGSIPGGNGGGGLTGAICDLLPAGILREACKYGGQFLPGGGGGGNGGQPGGGGTTGGGGQQLGPCPAGSFRVNGVCVAPGDMFPGGDPGMFPAGGGTVQGGFGMPAVTPSMEQRTVHKCPSGFVLGKDNLCYPKQILSRRSRYRKWKGDKRPPVTAADAAAIRRADRVKDRVKQLGKDVGLRVTNK